MTLAKDDLEQIKQHFFEWAYQWASEAQVAMGPSKIESELLERMARVEENLALQMKLIRQIIEEMNVRFDRVEKRFEQVEKRVELIEIRLEQMDKRFEQIDKRFEQVDRRFEQVDKRFEQVDRRFEELTRRIDRFMIWSFGTTVATGGIVLGVVRLWS